MEFYFQQNFNKNLDDHIRIPDSNYEFKYLKRIQGSDKALNLRSTIIDFSFEIRIYIKLLYNSTFQNYYYDKFARYDGSSRLLCFVTSARS